MNEQDKTKNEVCKNKTEIITKACGGGGGG